MKTIEYVKRINDKSCISTQSICEIFNISEEILAEWEKAGCPKAEQGWWDSEHIFEWLKKDDCQIKEPDNIIQLKDIALDKEIKLLNAQYILECTKNADLKAQYISKNELANIINNEFLGYRKTLLTIFSSISNEFKNPTTRKAVKKIINNRIDEAIEKDIRKLEFKHNIKGLYRPLKLCVINENEKQKED